ncbi:MAG: 50S ribosomal protein L6 [Planctomycetota bacterium]
MSRIGKKPIPIPNGVDVQVQGMSIRVKGPKGELNQEVRSEVSVSVEDGQVLIARKGEGGRKASAFHGLYRALIANMVHGVSTGFQRNLEIVGTGYNAKAEGKKLVLQIGFCHPIEFAIEPGIEVKTPGPTKIEIVGADKQRVGQLAADIRRVRPPEPYNGKGIRYEGEHVRRKAGKSFVGGG